MKYVNVIIDHSSVHTDNFFTYRTSLDEIGVGDKVFVPFGKGNKEKEAYVFEVLTEPPSEAMRGMKDVIRKDEEIQLSRDAIELCIWLRGRCLCRFIDCIKCFTPSGSVSKRGKERKPYQDAELDLRAAPQLTEEQRAAVDRIVPSVEKKEAKTFLIHGVTSSGKTEVYMQVIEACLRQGRGAIFLVPEISLTTQTIERIMGRFGKENTAVLHSRLSLGERYDEWMRIKRGQVKIVIGARSGIFAPMENLGAVIIDEEHETTYKSDMSPKYDTIEVAIQRAALQNAVVVLGSATPSLVSSYRAEIGAYEKVLLKERYNKAPLPEVEIADMREELQNGNKSIFSLTLYHQMKETLENGRQVILFLNRRGYSTFISCRNCGYVMRCPDCGIALTYHKAEHAATCHFCGHREPIHTKCPECESKYIKYFGTGTEKVEEAAREIFPDYTIARLDLDTAKRKGSTDQIIGAFKKGKTKILIGTQLVAKGLDFAGVGLVGVVSADISLNIPDFRSAERTFQLITQAAGRAGRGTDLGKVIIQSYTPEHYAIQTASEHDYETFYRTETLLRRQLGYPPYCDLIQLVLSGETEERVEKGSLWTAEEFLRKVGAEERAYVLGPQAAPMNKINGQFRYQILIKCQPGKREGYTEAIREIRNRIVGMKQVKQQEVLLSVDFNPYSFI